MSIFKRRSWSINGEPSTRSGGDRGATWDILGRFLQQLQVCDQTSAHMRLALEAVRESTGADVVYACELAGDSGAEVVADLYLPANWCRDFARTMVRNTTALDDGQLLRVDLPEGVNPSSRSPHSAALVCLSRSRQAWIVALSYDRDRVLGAADLKLMTFTKRLLINQKRYDETYGELKETLFGLIQCVTAMIDAKDPYTCGHSERVARIAVRLGQEMRLSAPEISDLYLAGLLHDVGKIGIRDEVLQKPTKLNEAELAHTREHPIIGERIIANVKKLSHLRPGVRNHHERHDGLGYPDGLVGEDVPLMARILAVADSCDAMMSDRRYRKALPTAEIDEIMNQGRGTQWDPRIVGIFMSCRHEIYPVFQRGLGQSVYHAVGHALNASGREPLSLAMPQEARAAFRTARRDVREPVLPGR
jgi:HD-GYP domain-containing protein (c-di-GMP phosphodiesterase class II)